MFIDAETLGDAFDEVRFTGTEIPEQRYDGAGPEFSCELRAQPDSILDGMR